MSAGPIPLGRIIPGLTDSAGPKSPPRLPSLRQELDLVEGPRTKDGAPTWTLHDPVRNAYFRLGWSAFEILARWAPVTADELAARVKAETRLDVDREEVESLLRMLQDNHLVAAGAPGVWRVYAAHCERRRAGPWAWLLHHYLFFRVPLLRPDVRVLDTSTAHRTAPGWVYGLPELHGTRAALAEARRVAVPGCHATGFITLAAPLVETGLLPADAALTCTSLTGYSGGGKGMIADYRAPGRPAALEACRPYGLGLHHKHLPEMQAVCGLAAPPLFVPVLGDYYCGMLTMLPLFPAQYGTTAAAIADTLAGYYAGEPMITVHPLGQGTENGFLAANALAGSDRLEIFCLPGPDGAQLQLISLFDNLGKGSSGAALQCLNAMLGLPETRGLSL